MTFEEFAAARLPVLVRTAAALGGDLGLAEDLVQEVMIKVHRQWDRIDRMDSRDSYVRRMLVNEFLSWRRKWVRVSPLADLDEVGRTDQPGGYPSPAAAYADRQLLRAEIGRLPKRRQVVLALRYYGGLSDAEIADALGCGESTVRSLASRALASLRINPTLRAEFTTDLIPADEGRAR